MFIFVLFSFPLWQLGKLGHRKLLVKPARTNYKFSDFYRNTGLQLIFFFLYKSFKHMVMVVIFNLRLS